MSGTSSLALSAQSTQWSVSQIPTISTSHLDQQTAEQMTLLGSATPWLICAEYKHGFFIDFSTVREDAPQCLHDIRDWAMKHEILGWVRLDNVYDCVDDLKSYDW